MAHYIKSYIICGMCQHIYKKIAHTQAFRMHFRLTWLPKPATGTRNQNHSKCHKQGIASIKFVNHTPLPLKVSKFGWNYTFPGGNFPISTVFCHSLSVPNVNQTYKLVNNTLTGPCVSHLLLIVKCATAHALCI